MAALSLFMLVLAFASGVRSAEEYDYSDGEKGPKNWGNLKEEWKICSSGKYQSPIDVKAAALVRSSTFRFLQPNYTSTTANLTSLDHDVAVEFASGSGTLMVDDIEYDLKELHVHVPSEHTVNNKSFPMEAHLVHRTSDSQRIAVVGIFYEIGKRNDSFIEQIEHLLAAVSSSGEAEVQHVDPRALRIGHHSYFRYSGSLTSPPCTEGVVWNILTKPRSLSYTQLQLIKNAMEGDNNRYTQDINGRQVVSYK